MSVNHPPTQWTSSIDSASSQDWEDTEILSWSPIPADLSSNDQCPYYYSRLGQWVFHSSSHSQSDTELMPKSECPMFGLLQSGQPVGTCEHKSCPWWNQWQQVTPSFTVLIPRMGTEGDKKGRGNKRNWSASRYVWRHPVVMQILGSQNPVKKMFGDGDLLLEGIQYH